MSTAPLKKNIYNYIVLLINFLTDKLIITNFYNKHIIMEVTQKVFEITKVIRKDTANRVHAKINEELRAQLADESVEKWLWTEEKYKIYKDQYSNRENFQPNVTKLRQCDVCFKVYNKDGWTSHLNFELYKRTGTRKLMR